MEEKKNKQKPRPVQYYAAGIVWVLAALSGSLGSLSEITLCALLSWGLFSLTGVISRKRHPEEEEPQPVRQTQPPKEAPKPKTEQEMLVEQGKEAVAKIRQLNDEIPDERMSAQIDMIERLCRQIFDCVIAKPDKLKDIRQFLNYYLPTTIKLMEQYVVLQNQSVHTDHMTDGMKRIEDLLDNVIVAFRKQLDSLFEADVVDITAEIRVMEQMMRSEGLGQSNDAILQKE